MRGQQNIMSLNAYDTSIVENYFSHKRKIQYMLKKNPMNDLNWKSWKDVPIDGHTLDFSKYYYRFKPEEHEEMTNNITIDYSDYRAYKNIFEYMKARKEHGPMMQYMSSIADEYMPRYVAPEYIVGPFIYFSADTCKYTGVKQSYNIEYILTDFKWEDGTPCGIYEKEDAVIENIDDDTESNELIIEKNNSMIAAGKDTVKERIKQIYRESFDLSLTID